MDGKIRNFNDGMAYRRFGKTDEILSVITLGGMRFVHGRDEPREEIPADTLDQAMDTVQRALNCGINHIETAYGYRKSETAYGIALNRELKIPRDQYYLMTKGNPKTAEDVRPLVESQLKALQTDYVDFYGWHGINNKATFDAAMLAVPELLRLKKEGLIRHVGFSTHGPVEIIVEAIETGLFEFMNLHYYYINQRNYPAVVQAAARDMGVFIISPNDKGGRLFNAPPKLRDLTIPMSPLQWNARFCLKTPYVHTLSFGMNQPEHFNEMMGIFPLESPRPARDREIEQELNNEYLKLPWGEYDGYELQHDPSGINVPDYLRYLKLYKCFDLLEYAVYRYNTHKPDDPWLPGAHATEENLALMDESKFPAEIDIKALMREAHELFYQAREEK